MGIWRNAMMFKLDDEIKIYEKEIKERTEKLFIDNVILRQLKKQVAEAKIRVKEMVKFKEKMEENDKAMKDAMERAQEQKS